MSAAPAEIALILAMAAATYLTRVAGYWLASRMDPGPFLRAWLDHLPGAVFAALVAQMVAEAGPAGWAAAAVGFVTMRWTKLFFVALAAGVLAYLLLRNLI
ncbi:MAG: AzlD domain-containing protein [Geminicoccaceae bacterium]